jgi:hypothetical protein
MLWGRCRELPLFRGTRALGREVPRYWVFIGLKLQSFGLIEGVERRPFKVGPDEKPYRLLKKGARFITFVRM